MSLSNIEDFKSLPPSRQISLAESFLGEKYLRVSDALAAFKAACDEEGLTPNEYIAKKRREQDEADIRDFGQTQDGRTVLEALQDKEDDPEYDPNSPEPRFVQLANAELLSRRDLKCKDCGYVGLPVADGNCPDCGGQMSEPTELAQDAAMSTQAIRDQIRQQIANQMSSRSKQTQQETVKRAFSTHSEHDMHLHHIITHYGFRSDGDHYVLHGDPDSKLFVVQGKWIHNHHGVRHEGHGHESLENHLKRQKG
jgi:hypothetical protein